MSETVTNAVIHAGGRVCVEVIARDGVIRVEVRDSNGAFPRLRDPGPDSASGRGLTLLDRLASSWGTRQEVDGKTVWFEFRP